MIKEEYKYSKLTEKIIGCAMTVHKILCNGFQEVIYQRALEIEMNLAGIDFQREFEIQTVPTKSTNPNNLVKSYKSKKIKLKSKFRYE